MIDKELCELLIKQYYSSIYKYCRIKLRDADAAEECAQEVFFLMFRKRGGLDVTKNLRAWLYGAADRICRAYLRKHRTDTVDIDELAEELPADEPAPSLEKIIHEALDEDEAKLFIEYTYADAEERMRISQRLGISKNAMYLRIKRIRAKIIEYLS